jgi:sterol desaturase/sphingolipid hydroxylase (fatty acid hydroxylase superfamily)
MEIGISLAYKMALVYTFGINFYAVAIFEIILNFMAMFNHSNIYIPHKLERFLRLFIVTPQMHLVHHAEVKEEHNTNYGFNLSLWDYLFGTYLETKKSPTGLKGVKDSLSFKEILLFPFKSH